MSDTMEVARKEETAEVRRRPQGRRPPPGSTGAANLGASGFARPSAGVRTAGSGGRTAGPLAARRRQ
ncbi:hypothetical protein LMG27174_03484 [Paraburkholderia rhynchosiae]|uniref:Uncharacterized protein n=1 Tax=Paraburkholderia rhynchosiae TaxID=487049 RepID=A0A6J5BBB3_9BURK|nr:hypothetical protein LMG27174_03484 [Paraburkholderia rhynchosiae]